MNIYKSLDCIFPVGTNRTFGEVVAITILFEVDGLLKGKAIFTKRKAWHVDASVNAFHVHRGLIREFSEEILHLIPKVHVRRVKRLIALATLNSYLANNQRGAQYLEYRITMDSKTGPYDSSPACWCTNEFEDREWYEVVDYTNLSLVKQVWDGVDRIYHKRVAASEQLISPDWLDLQYKWFAC